MGSCTARREAICIRGVDIEEALQRGGYIDRIKVSGTHVLTHRTRINVVASSVQETKARVAKFERDIA